MIISREISADIMKYLQEEKGQSVNNIAESMSTSPEFIQFVIEGKLQLTTGHINAYTEKNHLRFWEFADAAISKNHLSPSAKKRIQICKELTEHIKKREKNA